MVDVIAALCNLFVEYSLESGHPHHTGLGAVTFWCGGPASVGGKWPLTVEGKRLLEASVEAGAAADREAKVRGQGDLVHSAGAQHV